LIWVVNQGVVEMHAWVATRQNPEQPTWMFFDLDPVATVPFERVLEVAGWIGEMLDALGLLGLPKTSGGDGVHIFVPLAPGYSFEEVRAWLGSFIEQLERNHPGAITSDKRLAAREGKVLIDYSQNAMGKSIVAPYSVRAKPGAPVSAQSLAAIRCLGDHTDLFVQAPDKEATSDSRELVLYERPPCIATPRQPSRATPGLRNPCEIRAQLCDMRSVAGMQAANERIVLRHLWLVVVKNVNHSIPDAQVGKGRVE
jgi:hypothetical protein